MRIENLELVTSDRKLSLSYFISLRQQLTRLFQVASSIVCLAATAYLSYKIVAEGFQWIYLIISVVFGFTGFIQSAKVITFLKRPVNHLLLWKKDEDFLTLRNQHKQLDIALEQLKVIEYQLMSDTVTVDANPKNRFWITARLALKNGSKEHLFDMETTTLLTYDNLNQKTTLRKSAKQLTGLVGKELGIECRWKGEKRAS